MNTRSELAHLQHQLLQDPRNTAIWSALAALLANTNEANGPLSPPLQQPPTRTQVSTNGLKPPPARPAPRAVATIDLDRPRPLRRSFASHGSERFGTALREHRNHWLEQVREQNYDAAVRSLDHSLVGEWCAELEPLSLYQFGHWCHEKSRHRVAIALLEQVSNHPEGAELAPWASLYGLRSAASLGQIEHTRQSLQALADAGAVAEEDGPSPLQEAREQVAFHAKLSLAWVHLACGEGEKALEALEGLRQSPLQSTISSEVDLLGRVLSTLQWLEENPRNQLSHIADRSESSGFIMALDAIQLSSCGTLQNLQGWIIDPGNQLEHLCLIQGTRVQRLNLGTAKYQSRADLADQMARCGCSAGYEAGFRLTLVRGEDERMVSSHGEGMELFVVLRNGEQFLVRRQPVSSELTTAEMKHSVDTLFSDRCELLAPEAAVKLRAAWSDQLRRKMECPPTLKRYGPVPEQPELSIVVPLYGRIDFMEYQLNWFNAWLRRGGDEALRYQLIYVLDDPRLKQTFEALARRCHTLYRMPFETVINATNLGYAGANNVGSRQARGDTLLLLNSDVLPERQESFAILLRAFQQHRGMVGALGARLLFDNGGIQHAGMEFVRQDDLPGCLSDVWLNEHPMKGLNLGFAEDERACLQEVEAATAACLMLSTELFRELGGLSTDFVIGDFEDSDLCLRIRAMGLPVLVDLEASFYHLERQSVGHGESNDLLKTKVVALNALTQQERWGGAIELLKRSRLEAMG
ncbi:glycosyltransferase family 2 protein [Synechococcus sp. Cruz-9H2]|uniref:glycosyltransferase family 2 protein n=1 Tax=unclassified Synechococcus TaxID=2626047 RepID=UPI0020CC4224|nr:MULTISPECIES: glycosyltransferase [unclassified Synechococcus]MCP9818147.1 glycosyltransferase family 2 protein [Synechococcus sp. Cruz-9H2]MCP9842353.1 glycosyltransferase family 2 protein [Synechococcus sp. Edmonson 11F2]MCP9854543.1 glycosyltransferase family 2 protein [Synechococcus sp. Cruz-9C9]MCP9869055.1 glycosyltransferase family 2 protein [Synechococcus sp. Cruz-7B9]